VSLCVIGQMRKMKIGRHSLIRISLNAATTSFSVSRIKLILQFSTISCYTTTTIAVQIEFFIFYNDQANKALDGFDFTDLDGFFSKKSFVQTTSRRTFYLNFSLDVSCV
jgi:hypothetical protein